MIAAGIASDSDRTMYGCSTSQALRHGSSVQTCGRFHCAAAVVSLDVLKLPTTTTYTGMRTNSRKSSSRRYLIDRLSRVVPSAPVRGLRRIAAAVVPVAASTAVIRRVSCRTVYATYGMTSTATTASITIAIAAALAWSPRSKVFHIRIEGTSVRNWFGPVIA